ncbi:MAG: DUF5060 domain-containing protein, partial [Candidatus Tectimicrobiota bacterium]
MSRFGLVIVRWLPVCLALLLAVASAQAERVPLASDELNLLVNGDMEAGPWQHTVYARTTAERSWSTDSSYSASHALKTTAPGRLFAGWMASAVAVSPGAAYQVALWSRTEGITGGVSLNISWRDAAGKPVQWTSEIGGTLRGTGPWRRLSGEVRAPSQARQAVVEVRIVSEGGTAWLDDALLAPAAALPPLTPPSTPPIETPVEPPTVDPPAVPPGRDPVGRTSTATQYQRWEQTLASTQVYANPFTDVTVRVDYHKAGAPPLRGYAFWDGGATFRLRQAFPEPGTWTYTTSATNP